MRFEKAISKYQPTIGIEVHVELDTLTKIFCPAKIDFDAEPNLAISPVSLGLPGALPVVNEKVIEYACKIGLALNAKIAEKCIFARKNYFYPDLTKNFQTSQSDEPIVYDGNIEVSLSNGKTYKIGIERAHMEEDAGKNTHVGGASGRIQGAKYSLVDYNRAGVPLVEIVSRPFSYEGEIMPQLAAAYVRSLRDIFKALGVSKAQMEKGNVRADINVSLSPIDSHECGVITTGFEKLGTRTETKNVNSFRSITNAVRFEIERQADILEAGEEVLQETRHWHENTASTSSGRPKSDSDDYRYFPEPNLVPIILTKEYVENLRANLPELPAKKNARLKLEWNLADKEFNDILNANALSLIEQTVLAGCSPDSARKWWMGELSRIAKEKNTDLEDLPITATQIAQIQKKIEDKQITDKIARQVLTAVLAGEGEVDSIIDKQGLATVSDDNALEDAIKEAIERNPDVAQKLSSGNMAPIGVLIGTVMKITRGQADAGKVRQMIMAKFKS